MGGSVTRVCFGNVSVYVSGMRVCVFGKCVCVIGEMYMIQY